MTLRAHIEAIRDRHTRRGQRSSLCRCGELWPCPDNADAVAALSVLPLELADEYWKGLDERPAGLQP